jgi:hypothetical protein
MPVCHGGFDGGTCGTLSEAPAYYLVNGVPISAVALTDRREQKLWVSNKVPLRLRHPDRGGPVRGGGEVTRLKRVPYAHLGSQGSATDTRTVG